MTSIVEHYFGDRSLRAIARRNGDLVATGFPTSSQRDREAASRRGACCGGLTGDDRAADVRLAGNGESSGPFRRSAEAISKRRGCRTIIRAWVRDAIAISGRARELVTSSSRRS